MAGHDRLPEFISVECHLLEPVAVLYALGYRRYHLVDQNPVGGFVWPAQQMEGVSLERHDFLQASGLFGLDVFGDGQWLDINQMRDFWICVQPQRDTTWFDCHALDAELGRNPHAAGQRRTINSAKRGLAPLRQNGLAGPRAPNSGSIAPS
jgi:hypothetical protein